MQGVYLACLFYFPCKCREINEEAIFRYGILYNFAN
jgi:hypothetical protein